VLSCCSIERAVEISRTESVVGGSGKRRWLRVCQAEERVAGGLMIAGVETAHLSGFQFTYHVSTLGGRPSALRRSSLRCEIDGGHACMSPIRSNVESQSPSTFYIEGE
jgi:hypothetical protein